MRCWKKPVKYYLKQKTLRNVVIVDMKFLLNYYDENVIKLFIRFETLSTNYGSFNPPYRCFRFKRSFIFSQRNFHQMEKHWQIFEIAVKTMGDKNDIIGSDITLTWISAGFQNIPAALWIHTTLWMRQVRVLRTKLWKFDVCTFQDHFRTYSCTLINKVFRSLSNR